MSLSTIRQRVRLPRHTTLGVALVVLGEALIVVRARPWSDFYFPFVWIGYVLVVDGAVGVQLGRSLFMDARRHFLAMFPISIAFWWLFELFNEAVHNWTYIGAGTYQGLGYVLYASVDFGTVLLGVWVSAQFISGLLPARLGRGRQIPIGRGPARWPALMFCAGLACLALPILWPRYFFGMIWTSMFLLVDPINERLDRPSMLAAVRRGEWRLPLCFALGALMCGFFWEGWNYWSMPKWVYTIPFVNHMHIFEMPLLGWGGYLPFGLELFAMANFVFPLVGLSGLTLLPKSMAEGQRSEGALLVS